MEKLPREVTMENESLILGEFATKSADTRGRVRPETPCDIRTEFQRDRDRIIHCNSFRRLKHKTQVFLTPISDHYRTRLTHTLEVAQIARTIARALRLNEDLTEAIALGHDLGHTPFGHDGERTLDSLYHGGFKHYLQSVRVVELIERDGRGLNLTHEVIDGIKCHTNMTAETLEGVVVRYSDVIAYINHDIEDSIRAGLLRPDDIPEEIRKTLGDTKSRRISTLIRSIIENSDSEIRYSPEIRAAHDQLKDFMFENIYYAPATNEEKHKACKVTEFLYKYFNNNPTKMPEFYQTIAESEETARAVCDFVAGMTDGYAVELFKELCIPKSWNK